MLLLTSTSDIIRVVTASAVATIGVHASWVDNASGTITPGRTNTAITTATTTTVVGSPAGSTQRNVKSLLISNNHASASCLIALQHYDGTTSVDLLWETLLAGESVVLTEEGVLIHYDANGAPYSYVVPASANLGPTGTLAETMPRELCAEVAASVPTASGTMFMQAIYLTAGQLISNISIHSAGTAVGTPTNYFFALYSANRALLAVSANQGTAAWAANTMKTLAMTTPYRVPVSGLYYVAIMIAATTMPTLKGNATKTGSQLAGQTPILHGTSSTGITTAMPDPAAAITVGTATIYAAVS